MDQRHSHDAALDLRVAMTSNTSGASGGTPSWHSGPSPSPTPRIETSTPSTPLPPPNEVVPRSLTERESQLVKHLSRLQFFLATAPTRWMGSADHSITPAPNHPGPLAPSHPNLNRFLLPNGEHIACVFWNGLYHITGTDIVRALVFRFEAFSRPVRNIKKFEEGVFSDLRNLKPGTDACLEEPKSAFLDLLFRNGCIRTQKKQKVFYWFSVPHDRLFLDALERDLKREKMRTEPTTIAVGEPARSFRYDPKRSLFEQFAGKQQPLEESSKSGDLNSKPPIGFIVGVPFHEDGGLRVNSEDERALYSPDVMMEEQASGASEDLLPGTSPHSESGGSDRIAPPTTANSVLFSRSLFEGSPAYKQRRKKSSRNKKQRYQPGDTASSAYDSGEEQSGSDSDGLHGSSFSAMTTNLDEVPLLPSSLHRSGQSFLEGTMGAGGLNTSSSPATRFDALPASSPEHAQVGAVGQNTRAPNSINWPPIIPSFSLDSSISQTSTFASYETSRPNITTPPLNVPGIGAATGVPGCNAKGFSCPLLSCGRLFKRLEHLKRHVRTHTQERPYECTRCAKRFSRSDNLTQHHKTHEKADRGERMKTEASESTEDDMATFLEAEVDAMVATESRNLSSVMDGFGGIQNTMHNEVPYPMAGRPESGSSRSHGPPSHPIPSEATMQLSHASAQQLQRKSIGGEWTGFGMPFRSLPPRHSPNTNAVLAKRHRSMTPNLSAANRTGFAGSSGMLRMSPGLNPSQTHSGPPPSVQMSVLPHPGLDQQPYHRSTSLDPAAFGTRRSQPSMNNMSDIPFSGNSIHLVERPLLDLDSTYNLNSSRLVAGENNASKGMNDQDRQKNL